MFDYVFDRNYLLKILTSNVCQVSFEKINGEKRIMKCTLMEKFLPPMLENKKTNTHKQNLENLSVYDLEKNDWRSFKIANVYDVSIIEL